MTLAIQFVRLSVADDGCWPVNEREPEWGRHFWVTAALIAQEQEEAPD